MFRPKYIVSAVILSNIKRIAVLIAELNGRTFPDVALMELEKNAREVSVSASTSIEGNPLSLTDVKRILKHTPAHLRDTEKEVLNYNKALFMLNESMRQNKVLVLSLILKIHAMVMRDLIGTSRCGRLRKESVFVNNPRLQNPIYLPPDHGDVPKLMEELLVYVKRSTDKIDSLILAGIFHKQFVIIHPFMDGNGRTVRLTTKMLLAGMGLDTFNLFSFENYYNKNVSRYFQKVGVLGDYYDIADTVDFTQWLEYFTDGIIDELLRVKKILYAVSVEPEKELKIHHKKMIEYIEKNGYINDALYAKLTPRAKATRTLDFNKLIEWGEIVRFEKGRKTYYKVRQS